jgi:hypothetical protein
VNLDIDKQQDLNGCCDFVISKSPEQYYLNAPIIAVVEVKNESIAGGLNVLPKCLHHTYLTKERVFP